MVRMMVVFLGVASSIAVASHAAGQGTPTREFGVDLAIRSVGSDGSEDRLLEIGAPVDVRIGFLTSGRASFEPRFGLSFLSDGDNSLLQFSPSMNVVFGTGGLRPHLGPYFTMGVLMDMVSFGGTDSETRTQYGLNVGVGNRIEWGQNGAIRPEVFVTKKLKRDTTPGSLAFGLRLGLSFFH